MMRDVAVEDDVVIRLQAKSFSSFSYEQKWNVLDAGRSVPDLKLVGYSKTTFFKEMQQTCWSSSTGYMEAIQKISCMPGRVLFFLNKSW